jgi:hypothetical protein
MRIPEWVLNAEAELTRAKAMPPGPERQKALRKAGEMRNAAIEREVAPLLPRLSKTKRQQSRLIKTTDQD